MQSKVQNSNQSGNIEMANSPIEQKEQPQHSAEETEKHVDGHLVLEVKFLGLGLDIHNKKHLRVKLEKGRSGQKFFKISVSILFYL